MYDDSGTLVSGLVRRLPAADGGRHDQLRHRPHHVAVARPTRSAPRASARPARSPRRRPWSTRSSTRSGTSGSTTSRCRARPSGCGRRSRAAAAAADDRGRGDAALRRRHRATRSTRHREHGRSGRMIPAQFDYVAPTSVEEALAALAEHGDDAKVLAGGQSLLPVLRMRLNAPEMVIDLGRIDVAARRPRRRRRDRDRRDDHARRRCGSDPLVAEHAALLGQGDRAPRRRRRSGTAARSAARSRTPTRPATSAPRRSRSARSS